MLESSTVTLKTAQSLWSANQLAVMHGLDLPTWVNPAPAFTAALPSSAQTAALENISASIAPINSTPIVPIAPINNLTQLAHAASVCQACALGRSGQRLASSGLSSTSTTLPRIEYLFVLDPTQAHPLVLSLDEQRLMTAMLASKGVDWSQADTTPLLKCARSKNHAIDAFSQEIHACNQFLLHHIALTQPKTIVAMGELAAQALLGIEDSLSLLSSEAHEYEGISLVVMPHPAQILAQPALKAQVWQTMHLV